MTTCADHPTGCPAPLACSRCGAAIADALAPHTCRLQEWTARYTMSASSAEEAAEYIIRRALRDVPNASAVIVTGPTRDAGHRAYWRATVRRVRDGAR